MSDRIVCNVCQVSYSPLGGGHCRGGEWGGCCRTFSSDDAGDRHRIGPYNPPGQRRCITDEELMTTYRQDGTLLWRHTPKGWTTSRPMDAEARQSMWPKG